MDDLEAQISQAADELVREGRGKRQAEAQQPKAKSKQPPAQAPAPELRPVERPATSQPASFAPANDDRQKDFRAILGGLNKRASNSVNWVVAVLSLVWLGASALWPTSCSARPSGRPAPSNSCWRSPQWIMFVIGAFVPVILFWAFAAMVRRAQEMRMAAQSMTEMAFRLAEPENLAQDRVMMVGQAVRREVAAMGEGIERTLARAVELETLVHTEVNQIERSYSENAARIRLAGRWTGQRARSGRHPCRARARLDHRRA